MDPTVQPLRQCVECGQVFLVGEPAADRIPRTCPNGCEAMVIGVSPALTTFCAGVVLCR